MLYVNFRTKVYSGNKVGYTTVPTLYDMCIRILIENIDGEYFSLSTTMDYVLIPMLGLR